MFERCRLIAVVGGGPPAHKHVPLLAAPRYLSRRPCPPTVEARSNMMVHQAEALEKSMEFADIPGTPLKVSRVAIGTWAIGG
jgi:hypothetical protein